jgi:hypothetical protein
VSSQTRTRAREEERRLNIRTLAIASVASATAAVVTSQFWVAGTWMAAALTPVLVTLISEMLHRPTAVIAERFTSEGPAIRRRRGEAPPDREHKPEPPVRVYRTGEDRPRAGSGGRSRKGIAIGVVAVTAALAFAITAIALTGTELVTGGSIGKGDRDTTLFGGDQSTSTEEQEQTTPSTQDEQPNKGQETEPQQTSPDEDGGTTTPEEQPPPEQTTPRPAPQVPPTPTPDQP